MVKLDRSKRIVKTLEVLRTLALIQRHKAGCYVPITTLTHLLIIPEQEISKLLKPLIDRGLILANNASLYRIKYEALYMEVLEALMNKEELKYYLANANKKQLSWIPVIDYFIDQEQQMYLHCGNKNKEPQQLEL